MIKDTAGRKDIFMKSNCSLHRFLAVSFALCLVVGGCASRGAGSAESVFVSRWQTDERGRTPDTQIRLPLVRYGRYDFVVDWGDGTRDRITEWDAEETTHSYAEAGTYEIRIVGEIVGWSFNPRLNRRTVGDAPKLIEIQNWGPLAFGATQAQFYGARNLTISANDAPDLQETRSLAAAFQDAESLGYVASFATWNTSIITDMSSAFLGAKTFQGNLSSWDTSFVSDMSFMFSGAEQFDGDLSSWDTSNVVDMTSMFINAHVFNGNVSTWDVSRVRTFTNMFSRAYAFNGDISRWDTSSARHMNGVFRNAWTFNRPIGSWDTSNVETMNGMFSNADSFNQDIGGWDTGNVRDMERMFFLADSFNQDLSWWDTSSVTDMSYMFRGARSFDQDISLWPIFRVSDMTGMFGGISLSTPNYDALLISWAAQNARNEVPFSGGNSRYSPGRAGDARRRLMNERRWRITDGGEIE